MRRVIIMGPSWVVLVCLISASTFLRQEGPALCQAASVAGADIISNSSNVPVEAINMTRAATESNPSSSPPTIIAEVVALSDNNNGSTIGRAAEPKHDDHDDDDHDDKKHKHKHDDDDDDDDHEHHDKNKKNKKKPASVSNNLSITETILEGNSSKRPCPLSHRPLGNSSLPGSGISNATSQDSLTPGTALEKISESIVGVMSTIKNSVASIFSPGAGLPAHGINDDLECNHSISTSLNENSTLETTTHPAAGGEGANSSSIVVSDVVQPVSLPEGSTSTEISSVPSTTMAATVSSTPLTTNETVVVSGNLTSSTTTTTAATTTATPSEIGA